MKIAFLYTKSELTPWKENVNKSTIDFLINNIPSYFETKIVHFDGFNDDVLNQLKDTDLVFNLSYGYQEAGQVEVAGWLDYNNITHTASDTKSMRIAQDKSLLPDICSRLNLETPVIFFNTDLLEDETLYISKPRKGSCHRNIDIKTGNWMKENIDVAKNDLIIQPYIKGREFSVAVIPSSIEGNYIALPPVEIKPIKNTDLYIAGQEYGATSKDFKPKISAALKSALMSAALKLHKNIGLTNMSRTDFRVDDNEVLFTLDVNAMPNMDPEKSILPAVCRYHGIEVKDLMQRIISNTLNCEGIKSQNADTVSLSSKLCLHNA